MYVIDTSALLDGWVRYYPPDVFPPLWSNLEGMITAGELLSPDDLRGLSWAFRHQQPPRLRPSCSTASFPGLTKEHSCCQRLVKFIEQLRQIIPKELVRFAEAAALAEWRVVEIIRLDAEAGSDVVADEFEPCALFRGKDHGLRRFSF